VFALTSEEQNAVMKKYKSFFAEPVGWDNPIKKSSHLLYLADEIFPSDSRLDSYKESQAILRSFYSSDRSDYSTDVNKLNSFLHAPNEQLLVIEGAVGIGKSWFVRYNLEINKTISDSDGKPSYHSGVIDLLRAVPDNAESHIFKQVCPILEDYFTQYFGSPASALQKYSEEKYRLRFGVKNNDSQLQRIRAGAARWVDNWLSLQDGKEYAEVLLQAIESLSGPLCFLVIDNVDRLSDADQERLVAIVQKVLRNTKIRLIVPLRDTTPLLIDRFRGLNEVRHESMRLGRLNIESMLKTRFAVTKTGESLEGHVISDILHKDTYTYPDIFRLIFCSETGDIIKTISGGNCRVALHMTKRLIESNQIKALRHFSNPQYAIAALMLLDTSEPDPASPLLSLFDNKERGEEGNALIRYRVLELFIKEQKLNLNDQRIKNYFYRLGYPPKRIRKVVSRLMMASLLYSLEGYTPEAFVCTDADDLGYVVITETGEAYQKLLLNMMWYYVVAKYDLAPNMPEERQSQDMEKGYYYITHTDFVEYIKDEERLERGRARKWDSEHGPKFRSINLSSPSIRAKAKLLREEVRGTDS